MGIRPLRPNRGSAAVPTEMYAIPNRRMTTHVVSLPTVWETPLRTGNLRDPNGPQIDIRRPSRSSTSSPRLRRLIRWSFV